jgi:ribonuclease VapC
MLADGPEAERLEAAVEADPVRLMSTASYLESAIVIETRFGEAGGRELDLWLHRPQLTLSAWMPTKPMPPESPTACMARDATAQA